jgi:DNA polymerase-3 subunit epsilon
MTFDRPLIVVDCETTGTDTRVARIVQLAFLVVTDEGTKKWNQLINPGIPIPPEATKIHGITDEMVKDAPAFSHYAPNLAKGFVKCAFAGYRVTFDLDILREEFKRAGIDWSYDDCPILDALRLWQHFEPRTLSDAVKQFLGRELSNAHDALADIEATYDVLKAQLQNPKLGVGPVVDTAKIHAVLNPPKPVPANAADGVGKLLWQGDQVVLNFGKHIGKPLTAVPKSYLWWIAGETGMPEGTRRVARAAIDGRMPVKEEAGV